MIFSNAVTLRTSRSAPAAVALALSLAACAGGGPLEEENSDSAEIDRYISNIERAPVPEPGKVFGPLSTPELEGDYTCTKQQVQETRNYDSLVAYAANSEALWPGAILAGSSLDTGDLVPLPFDRKPMTFSVSLVNLDGDNAVTLDEPKLSTYRTALADILGADIDGSTPANLSSDIQEIQSEKQLGLALGIKADALFGLVAKGGLSFDFSRDDVKSRFLVKYTQAYYTVDVDPPKVPSDYLADSVTVEEVQDRVKPNEPPLYVSSITYGRTVLFSFESEKTANEVKAALNFAYKGGANVDADLEAHYKSVLDSTSIHAYILGGSGEKAAQGVDDYDALMDFIKTGGDYSKDSPGAPIAYKLAFLSDNQPALVSLSEDYELQECHLTSQSVRVILNSIHVESTTDSGNDLEIYGDIWVETRLNNNLSASEVLFDRSASNPLQIKAGESFPPQGYLAEVILDVTPEMGHSITIDADLSDQDPSPFNEDDSLGAETLNIPFESGWNRDTTIYLSGSDSLVELNFTIESL